MIRISLSARYLLYLILVALVLLTIYSRLRSAEACWLLWSGLLLSLIIQDNTFSERLLTLVVTFLASLVCVLLATSASNFPFVLAPLLFFTTLACAYLAQRYPEYSFGLLIINLFAILGGSFSASTNGLAMRLILMSEGACVALLLQFIFWPGFKKSENIALTKLALLNLQYLSRDIFDCFLQRDYSDNQYMYERRLHEQKIKFMQTVVRLKKIDVHQVTKLNRLFEILLDCAQLRGRVSDFSIFQVCEHELQMINAAINRLLSIPLVNDVEPLLEAINRLEENYQQVLLVTAKEPLPFILFIASLRAFSQAIGGLKI